MNEQDQTDLEELLEILDQNPWQVRWYRMWYAIEDWWIDNRSEWKQNLIAMAIVMAILIPLLWWASSIGAQRMSNAMTCPYDDQVRTAQGYCVNPEMYVDSYIDQLNR